MTSSMFARALSSSESESDDEQPVQRIEHRFMHYPVEEEESKRVVKSARDKRIEELQSIIKNLNNHKKIKDMSNIITDFESLVRTYEKSLKMNEVEGVPTFYLRCIADLEDFVNDCWEKKKDMNKGAAKALTILKQRVRKYNRDFEDNIKDFREHPEDYQEELEDFAGGGDDDEDDNEEVPSKPSAAPEKFSTGVTFSGSEESGPEGAGGEEDEESDSDEDFWDSDSSSSSSSSLDLDLERFKDDPSVFFLKKTTDEKKEKTKKPAKKRPAKKSMKSSAGTAFDDQDGAWTTVADGLVRAEPQVQAFERGQEITHDVVLKRLNEVISVRGKKGTSTSDQISLLHQIEEKIKEHKLSAGLHVKVLFGLINVILDYDKKNTSCLTAFLFDRLLGVFDRLFDLLEHNTVELVPRESVASDDDIESLLAPPYRVFGSLLTVVSRLDGECTKVLQNANGHDLEYVDRLRDERHLCSILDQYNTYLQTMKAPSEELCASHLMIVEHLYYKFDFAWARRVEAEGLDAVGPYPSTAVIERLCQYIYQCDQTDRLRTRAILCHIYHLALYDNWFRARDLMLMSNLQMSIEHADQSTMILYNRAMVQLGLAAFRQGYIREAHNALADLVGSSRVRELLAQGLSNQVMRYDRTAEEERREAALRVPYHMHINTELLECVYLVCAMLLEIPYLAAHETDLRWRPISKHFHLALRVHDRATLVGPPECPRDFVLGAAKAMRYGLWKACVGHIINAKMDAKVWNLLFQSNRVRTMLETKIKEESLRSFLFTYSAIHDTLSLDRLADYFELPKSVVYSTISKMIINQELAASLETPDDFLIMHKNERSRLQTLALQLSDRVSSIVEMNEKLIESRGGTGPGGTAGILGGKGSQAYQGPRRQPLRYTLSKFN